MQSRVGYRIESFGTSKYQNIGLSKYRIENVLPSITWHPRLVYVEAYGFDVSNIEIVLTFHSSVSRFDFSFINIVSIELFVYRYLIDVNVRSSITLCRFDSSIIDIVPI